MRRSIPLRMSTIFSLLNPSAKTSPGTKTKAKPIPPPSTRRARSKADNPSFVFALLGELCGKCSVFFISFSLTDMRHGRHGLHPGGFERGDQRNQRAAKG